MKTALAFIGAVVVMLYLMGAFGVGHFVLMYGPDKITCVKGTT